MKITQEQQAVKLANLNNSERDAHARRRWDKLAEAAKVLQKPRRRRP